MDEWKYEWMDGLLKIWMDGWITENMNGWYE